MTARLLLALVLCADLCQPVMATAAPAGTLTITGTSTSRAILRVPSRATYDLGKATITYSGSYGGFAIGSDDAALWSRLIPRDRPAFFGGSATAGVLKPGSYPVRLFSDNAPVTVTIPWSLPDLTVSPSVRFSATIRNELAPVVQPGGKTTALAVPLDGAPGDSTSLLIRHDAVSGRRIRLTGCFTPRRDACDLDSPATRNQREASGDGIGVSVTLRQRPSPVATRDLDARGEVRGQTYGSLLVVVLRYTP